MPLFRRKDRPPADPRPAVSAFWQWWAARRGDVLAAAAAGRSDTVAALLAGQVAALHQDLEWELRPGAAARVRLVVSPGGRQELRALTERWLLAGPPADEEVEYAAARGPSPDALAGAVEVEGFEIPLGETVAGTRVDPARGRLDVAVHHPLFPLLSEEGRGRVAFLALDAALGEDDVERWLGVVDLAADEPIDAIPLATLPAVVDHLRGEGGGWVVLHGTGPSGPVQATVRRPFGRVDRPLCDTHVALLLPYAAGSAAGSGAGQAAGGGLPAAAAALGEQAVRALGGDGAGAVLVGHESGEGRAVVHLYVDGLTVDAEALRPLLSTWPEPGAQLHVRADPAWRRIGHLLV